MANQPEFSSCLSFVVRLQMEWDSEKQKELFELKVERKLNASKVS